uniref:Putative ovule protein n=1 Tax=Solanum chacoense TaxID=4108 RepID=A0A0V0H8Y9_SOLCH
MFLHASTCVVFLFIFYKTSMIVGTSSCPVTIPEVSTCLDDQMLLRQGTKTIGIFSDVEQT